MNGGERPTFATDDATLEALVLSVQLRVAAFGWRLGVTRSHDVATTRVIAFQHPLATTHDVIVFPDTPATQIERMLEFQLKSRDVILISDAPSPLLHPQLMYALRAATAQRRWSPKVLYEVTEMLIGAGLLTSWEAEWVVRAGPCVLRDDEQWDIP